MDNQRVMQPEKYHSVSYIAKLLGLSDASVTRRFEQLEGVLDLGSPETLHKRRKRMLRIPESVLVRYIASHQTRGRK